MSEFPYLYRHSRAEARRRDAVQMHEDSFRVNVSCARAIEQAIRDHSDDAAGGLKDGCAQSVLEQYGFQRVNFVLANSLQEFGRSICKELVSDETYQWGRQTYVPKDGEYNRYYAVDTAAASLESFIGQTRQAYQELGLFGTEHCIGDSGDYEGKVLVISPDILREGYWNPRCQLWVAEGGFGCSPTASGRAVYATCLGDGEKTRWDRADFIGVLKDECLPDWAREKLEEIQSQKQNGPTMGGMG